MTDAPPPYPGINGNNGYRLETKLETRLEFAMLEKKKRNSHLTQLMYIAQLLFQGSSYSSFQAMELLDLAELVGGLHLRQM